ncbi:MAG: AAA family ATPase [Anaerolineaceae bacterium]|jgi:DNA replication protein DnaC|nr:MAG: AAA family ATPase [Anaerolineaceae bacterium]
MEVECLFYKSAPFLHPFPQKIKSKYPAFDHRPTHRPDVLRENMIVLGPTGSGKSFLTCAFGTAAVRNGFTVRYHRTSRLLHTLTQVRADGSLTSVLRSLARVNLLILDDWMRDAITIQNAQDILEVLDDRFGHTATLIASQVPIADWHRRIPDPTLADAILDRLVHTAHRIELKGESQRKLRAKRTMPNA